MKHTEFCCYLCCHYCLSYHEDGATDYCKMKYSEITEHFAKQNHFCHCKKHECRKDGHS